jgi:predicted ATP-grasp superfamily ATP-dependent carboligase
MTLPVVVLGIDTPIGLTVVRDLGSAGIRVYGIARTDNAVGAASRYLSRCMLRAQGEAALIAQLVELQASTGPACLMAISEGDISLLNRNRTALGGYMLLFSDAPQMDAVLNKGATYAAAARVGIRVPRTEQVSTLAEVELLSAGLRYPVVLKWSNPHGMGAKLHSAGLKIEKTHYCDSAAELLAYLRPFSTVGAFPLIQEYCAGYGLGQFVLMKDGQPYYTFQHRRVHEWPPEGGFSSQCESVPPDQHRDLMLKSVALLRELGWQGVAMVEYRYDAATGEAALMEINGRFWGSLPLAYHAGARFPLWLYQLHGLGQAPATAPYRSGMRCRFMIPETKRLVRILFAQHRIADKSVRFGRSATLLRYLGDFLHPASRYYVFEWRDPRPFLSDMAQMGRQTLGMVTAKLRIRPRAAAPGRPQ